MDQSFALIIVPMILRVITGAEWCYQSQFTCDHICQVPEKWKEGSVACGGGAQSPINIVTGRVESDPRLTPIQLTNYGGMFTSYIANNGHSVQVDLSLMSPTAAISGGNLTDSYKAVQFHLHWGGDGAPGSEHTIDGERYPMELHIVHIKEKYPSVPEAAKDPTGIAVLGLFYTASENDNEDYAPIVSLLHNISEPGSKTILSNFSLEKLLKPSMNLNSYYRYLGSLTTPGCDEAVVWTLFHESIPLGSGQLSAFTGLQFRNATPMVANYRPVQPLNQRKVYRSGSASVFTSLTLVLSSVVMSVGALCVR